MLLFELAFDALALPYTASATVHDFSHSHHTSSRGGKATCVVGSLQIAVNAVNTNLLYENPASQAILTDTINEFLRPGGNFTAHVLSGGPREVTGTYRIMSKLCWPQHTELEALDTVQILTHGGSLTDFYWDIGPGLSFVDAAAEAGFATLSYDRLGNGDSERPDPINVVQGSIQVEILHELTTALRKGVIQGHAFKKVIGNSHSLACLLTIGQANRYPLDLDAIILTGTSITADYVGATLAGPAYVPANTDARFRKLPSGYILYVGAQALQLEFFKYPYYDESVFREFVARMNTASLGEFFTASGLATPAKDYKGLVFVMNGEYDFPFCGGNCYYPSDQSALVVPALFPSAAGGSANSIIDNVGHLIFAHNRGAASDAFAQIMDFLQRNGLAANQDRETDEALRDEISPRRVSKGIEPLDTFSIFL